MCEQALDYVYGELDEAQKRAFEEHLPTCARCQAEVASFGRVRTATKRLMAPKEPTAQLGGALHAQLMHAAAQRKPRRGVLLSFPRRIVEHPALSAAAMFVIVGSAIAINWSRGKMTMPAAQDKVAEAPKPTEGAPAAAPAAATAAATPPVADDKPVLAEKAKEEAPEPKIALATPQGNLAVKRGVAHHAETGGKGSGGAPPTKLKSIAKDDSVDGVLGGMRDEAGAGSLGAFKSSAPADIAEGKTQTLAAATRASNAAPARAKAAPARVPSAPPPPASEVAADDYRMNAPMAQAAAPAPKPAAPTTPGYASVRKQADEFARTNRCGDAIKLYEELDKAGQYIAPSERMQWVRCLNAAGRQEEAQQRLDSLNKNELEQQRRVVDKKAAKKPSAAYDREADAAKQQAQQKRPVAEPAPAQAAPAATSTKASKQSY